MKPLLPPRHPSRHVITIWLVLVLCTGAVPVVLAAVVAAGASDARPVRPRVSPQTAAFPPAAVKLLDGPLRHSRDAAARYLLSLDVDRLLAPYFTEAGLKPKAEPYPGWETRLLPGVGLGFYLSGISRLAHDEAAGDFSRRIDYILDELAVCQQAADGWLLGTRGGRAIFSRIEKEGKFEGFAPWGDGCAEPYYALEKIFSGLRDAYRLAGRAKALELEIRLGDWLDRHMAHLDDVRLADLMTVEWGGLNWVLTDLYADTGDTRYLAMSRRWHDKRAMDGPAAGINDLGGKHANTQFPKFSGLAARYPYGGDPADLATARYFWECVVRHHSYVTGGNSQAEHFSEPDKLNDTLTQKNAENCNEYNMLRLTELLFNVEPRAEYAEFIERTLFNHLLPAQDVRDGRVCYFLPLKSGASRYPESLFEDFSCCVCSGFDSYARHAAYVYRHGPDALYVNLFAASELTWREKGLILRQETKFPDEDSATFRLGLRQPARFALHLRYPAWAVAGITVGVNGVPQAITATPGEFLVLEREWRDGDTVEFRAPFAVRSEAMPDNPDRMALFFGPILLAGDLGPVANPASEEPDFIPLLVPGAKPLHEWLEPTGTPLSFRTTVARPREIGLQPFYRLLDRSYAVYWDKVDAAGWQAHLDRIQSAREKARLLGARTIDRIDCSDPTAEATHHLEGPGASGRGNRGVVMHRFWRRADAGGSFSYRMKVPSGGPVTLYCRYSSEGAWQVEFDIQIDGTTIAHQAPWKGSRVYPDTIDASYAIPPELTAGKREVQVTFSSAGGRPSARLFELRMLKF